MQSAVLLCLNNEVTSGPRALEQPRGAGASHRCLSVRHLTERLGLLQQAGEARPWTEISELVQGSHTRTPCDTCTFTHVPMHACTYVLKCTTHVCQCDAFRCQRVPGATHIQDTSRSLESLPSYTKRGSGKSNRRARSGSGRSPVQRTGFLQTSSIFYYVFARSHVKPTGFAAPPLHHAKTGSLLPVTKL